MSISKTRKFLSQKIDEKKKRLQKGKARKVLEEKLANAHLGGSPVEFWNKKILKMHKDGSFTLDDKVEPISKDEYLDKLEKF